MSCLAPRPAGSRIGRLECGFVKRWHDDLAVMARRAREARRDGRAVELGEMRKHKASGCERPRCGLCRPSKRWYKQSDRARCRERWRIDWGV
jgi:hypothetical protein